MIDARVELDSPMAPSERQPRDSAPDRETEVFAEQVGLLERSARWGAGVGIVGLPVLGVGLFRLEWPRSFWLLCAVIAVVEVVTVARMSRVSRSIGLISRPRRHWARVIVGLTLAAALAWGILIPVYLTTDLERIAVLFGLVMVQIVSGTVYNAGYLPATYAYNVPIALPYIIGAALQPSALSRVFAIGALMMLGLMTVYAHKMHRVIVGSIRMRFENRDLSDALTEQRVQERTRVLEAANRHKSEFLASMSHELRTPLNAIIGYSEMLQEDAGDQGGEAMLADLRKINSAGKHLLEMINSVLDLSKIEAGRMELHLEEFELHELVADVQAVIEPLARANDNRVELAPGRPYGRLRADRLKLRQVLLNLLGNACKFTRSGSITLAIERAGNGEAQAVRFVVCDTGIGMTREQIGKLFEDFAQADSLTARQYGGTGLGLALSQRLCHLMGGAIAVQSEPGVGSTFVATLPVASAASIDGVGDLEQATGARAGTVLVIDDDAVVRELLQRFLAKEGYRVVIAVDGTQGIALAREHRPDAIVLDIVLPGIDGWAVLATLAADALVAHIPVIILSMLEDRKTGYALGAADYLTKPIDRAQLVAALRRYRRDLPVLVVDDDAAFRTLLGRILEAEGYAVVEAAHGRAALEAMHDKPPGVILLDLLMPEMDGFEFIAHIRQQPAWHDIPVVIVTAKEMTADDRRRLNGSVVRVLEKCATGRERLLVEVRSLVQSSLGARRRVAR